MKYSQQLLDALHERLPPTGQYDIASFKNAACALYDLFPDNWADIAKLLEAAELNVPGSLQAQSCTKAHLRSIVSSLAKQTGMDATTATGVTMAWMDALGVSSPATGSANDLARQLEHQGKRRSRLASMRQQFSLWRQRLCVPARTRVVAIIAIAVATAPLIACAGYCFREEIRVYCIGAMLLLTLYTIGKILQFVTAWPYRKLAEGVHQLKCAADWVPGWIYVVMLAALAWADWQAVLPYGMRDAMRGVIENTSQMSSPDPLPKASVTRSSPLPTNHSSHSHTSYMMTGVAPRAELTECTVSSTSPQLAMLPIVDVMMVGLVLVYVAQCCWLFGKWWVVKLSEGVLQIGWALDAIPGWVYVVLLATLVIAACLSG